MLRMTTIIALALVFGSCLGEEKKVELIKSIHDDMSCEVYFFKSWATYQHPVKPIGPIDYESALMREGFYRAWLCKKNGQDLFTYFEGVENKFSISKTPKKEGVENQIHFYESGKEGEPGNEISASETIGLTEFYASLPLVEKYLMHIKQKKGISYEYKYDDTGKPTQAIITGFDGRINILDL